MIRVADTRARLTAPVFRPRKCKHCREQFTPARQMQPACSIPCALGIVAAKKAKESRQATREARAKLKTRRDWINEAQAAMNRYVRLRDHGKGCISCGALPEDRFGGAMDCGHYRSRGSAPHLRFHLWNMSAQCVKDNRYGAGLMLEFRRGLIQRIGLEKVEALEAMQGSAKFDVEYLRRLKRVFSKKANRLEKRREMLR